MFSNVENEQAGYGSEDVSPAGAKAALLTVSDETAAAAWEPRRWAAAVVGVVFAPIVTAAAWGRFWWFFAGLALFGLVLVVLRRHLFNPLVRVRPWQHLDKPGERAKWAPAFWPLWIPVTMFVSGWPMWVGLVVGILAGIHTYWAMRQLGERR